MNTNERKIYSLYVPGEKVTVEKEVYHAYYQELEHEKYLKKRSREREYSFEGMQEQGISFEFHSGFTAASPEEQLLKELKYLQLREAIDRLAEEDRYLIRAVFWEEKTQSEIEAELGISQPTVNGRKKTVLNRLKNYLTEL